MPVSRIFLESLIDHQYKCKADYAKAIQDAQAPRPELPTEQESIALGRALTAATANAVVALNSINKMIDNYWANHGEPADNFVNQDLPF